VTRVKKRDSAAGLSGKRTATILTALAVFGGTWLLLLLLHEPVSRWCRVSVEVPIIRGQPVPITVFYRGLPVSSILSVDLHGYGEEREKSRYLATAGDLELRSNTGLHRFSAQAADVPSVDFVAFVLYVSPTGGWRDRTLAARTKPIKVDDKWSGGKKSRTRKYTCYSLIDRDREYRCAKSHSRTVLPDSDTAALYICVASLLCLSCALTCTLRRCRSAGGKRHGSLGAAWFAATFLFAAHAFLHYTGTAPQLTAWFREVFAERGWYSQRQVWQKLVVSACAFALAYAALSWKTDAGLAGLSARCALAASLALAGVTLVGLLSYHYADRALTLPVGGVTTYQLFEFAAAGIAGGSALLCHASSMIWPHFGPQFKHGSRVDGL
jgi:hypothetical protein